MNPHLLSISLIIAVIIILVLLSLLWTKSKTKEKIQVYQHKGAASVGKFYDEQTDNFLKVYGEVIQAFRTKNVDVLLDYQIESIGLKQGMKVIDAGCGVCGPASYFAKHADVEIDAVTISEVQVNKSKERIKTQELEDKVKVIQGDYHKLDTLFPKESYDAVYFLESFGHAADHFQVMDAVWEVLKPGGTLYIKDLFLKVTSNAVIKEGIDREARNINEAYHYNIPDLYAILDHLRKKGFIIANLKTIDIPLEDFENLTISNDFQELTGINKIENLRDYVFPVDFFELKCIKPWNDVLFGNSRYFLQNLYFMQIENWKEEEL